LKHGLTATASLPAVLGGDLVRDYYCRLCAEWRPTTFTQEFFVLELARHAVGLLRAEEIEHAVLCRGARGAPGLGLTEQEDEDLLEAALAGAGTSDALEKIARYRRAHERAYLRSLTALREARALAGTEKEKSSRPRSHVFDCEEACEAYLMARLNADGPRCPRCAGTTGKWIASRKVWQCRSCRRQLGIRTTTIMEKSRLGLLVWFRTIEAVLGNPSSSTAELSAVTGIRRQGTVRRMASQVRQAMNSPERTALLAGLDRVFGESAHHPAEISDPKK
jgi:hypothetical protein